MSRSNHVETDSEANRKPVAFSDETLPVISCKEIIQKDPVFVFFNRLFSINKLFLSSHSVNTSVQTKFEVELAEVACQSIKRKEREVSKQRNSFPLSI